MRLLLSMLLLILVTIRCAAQRTCPPTITVTAYAKTSGGITSSSFSRQVIYTTEFETTVIPSNGTAIVETMAKLVQVEPSLERQVDEPDSTTVPVTVSCPNAVTITVEAVPTALTEVLSTTSSSLYVTASSTTILPTPILGSITSTSGSHSSTSLPLSNSNSFSWNFPVASTSEQASSLASLSPASSYGVALDIWSTPTPTLQCVFPCQLKMPCMSLSTPTTITFPPYTTTLCKPGCSGSVQMKSTTVITLPVLTTNSVCFYPLTAGREGLVTPVPRWITDTRTIDAPEGLSTCPPVFARPAVDGKCGPENHHMCEKGKCCGEDGKCGSSKEFCDKGCQLNYGNCWKNSTSCVVPPFAKMDDTTPIPVFPVLYDDENKVILPPVMIITGTETDIPVCKNTCDDIICGILGCNGECGILSCSSIDLGWFKFKFPKTDCQSAARKATCALFNIGCCPEADNGKDDGCTIAKCTNEDEDGEVGINGDTRLCDPDKLDDCGPSPKESEISSNASSPSIFSTSSGCSSTTTVNDQTAHCLVSTDENGRTSTTCTSTAIVSPRKGCSIEPSTITSFTSGCETQTASHVTNECTFFTGTGNETRAECTRKATTFSGCDVTGTTTTSAVTECSNSNTVTNITSSCFATNITSMGSTFPGSGTCTGATSTVLSGCDLSGTVKSVTSYAENVCEYIPSDITIIPITSEVISLTSATALTSTTTASTTGGALDVLNSAIAAAASAASTDTISKQARWWRLF